jgi:hypothetical protein
VRLGEDAVLMLFMLVVANHAMLEYPLHYASFLLPVGLIVGALEQRLSVRPVLAAGRYLFFVLWLVVAAMLAVVIRDYLRVEESYRDLRFEWSIIKSAPTKTPEVLLLTQWRDFFEAVRLAPKSGMDESDVRFLRDLAGVSPSPGLFQALANSLALNGEPTEAKLWLTRACQMVSQAQCAALKRSWNAQSWDNAKFAAVNWPNE